MKPAKFLAMALLAMFAFGSVNASPKQHHKKETKKHHKQTKKTKKHHKETKS